VAWRDALALMGLERQAGDCAGGQPAGGGGVKIQACRNFAWLDGCVFWLGRARIRHLRG
jgi:hypothetical protein